MKSDKRTGKEISVMIDRLGADGSGIGYFDGGKLFMPKTAPGDVIRVDIGAQDERGEVTKLLGIENFGPERAEPLCPYFQKCGGCAAQHVTERLYREWKAEKVQGRLTRAGIEWETWETPIFLPAAQNGRRRTTLAAYKTGKGVRFGYNEARTHNIIDIAHCLVLEPELDVKIQALRPYLPRLLPDRKAADIMLQHVDGAFDMVLSGPYQSGGKFSLQQHEAMAELAEALDIARISWRPKDFAPAEILFARKSVLKKFGALTAEIPPGAFLQASAAGEQALAELVLKYTGGARRVADLFCGCGTFTGHLADREVLAADGDAQAIDALSKAAAGQKNISVQKRNLIRNPLSATELDKFEAVIFDPARAGARPQAAELARSKVEKIIGVSCNPATFAQDAKTLQEGGYKLRSLTLVDQFVYTAHVELVALFTR